MVSPLHGGLIAPVDGLEALTQLGQLQARVDELEARCPRCGFGHRVCMCLRRLEVLEAQNNKSPRGNTMTTKEAETKPKATATATAAFAADAPVVAALLTEPQQSWWDTYNAALSGMFANQSIATNGREYVHVQASMSADVAHGAYPPDPPPEPPL